MQSLVILGVISAVVFTVKYSGIALLPLAILLDGYYGAFYSVPLFSLATIGWYILSELLLSRMSVVQSKYE